MNPVDHPHGGVSRTEAGGRPTKDADLSCRVTTNILVRLLPCPDTPPRVRRPVLLLPEEPVCCVVLRRRIKSRGGAGFFHGLIGMVLQWRAYTSMESTAEGSSLVDPDAGTIWMTFLAHFTKKKLFINFLGCKKRELSTMTIPGQLMCSSGPRRCNYATVRRVGQVNVTFMVISSCIMVKHHHALSRCIEPAWKPCLSRLTFASRLLQPHHDPTSA